MAGTGRDSSNVSPKEELTLKYKFNTNCENLSDPDQAQGQGLSNGRECEENEYKSEAVSG